MSVLRALVVIYAEFNENKSFPSVRKGPLSMENVQPKSFILHLHGIKQKVAISKYYLIGSCFELTLNMNSHGSINVGLKFRIKRKSSDGNHMFY